MSDNDQARWLTIEHAAAAMSRSSRTVRRMASDGRLPSRKQGARLYVDVSAFVTDTAEESDVATLRSQVRDLTAQVDRLRDLVDRQDSEIQFLRSAHAAALRLQQTALEAPRRQWRWRLPWRRGDD